MRTIATTLERQALRSAGATVVFALLTAALAQMGLRLPFTPVPVTMQVFGVVLSGLLLGSRLGALAQIEYLVAGLAGAPVFAHFSGGPAAFIGPSGGYLPGFVVGAFVTGLIAERCRRLDVRQAVLAGVAGVAGIYLCGAAWLSVWLQVAGKSFPSASAWILGIAPFIGIDAVKVVFAAMVATGRERWRK